MSPKAKSQKLTLSKETLRTLSAPEMALVQGGNKPRKPDSIGECYSVVYCATDYCTRPPVKH